MSTIQPVVVVLDDKPEMKRVLARSAASVGVSLDGTRKRVVFRSFVLSAEREGTA
jgi:hypothetical protein